MNFSRKLLEWYHIHKRDLPWRETRDPYTVWLSEIILQQTRVAQGQPYFLRFKSRYPNVTDLAGAPEEEVLKLWQGLGYYSRARNLHATARRVAFEMDGVFPESYEGLLDLKGVGPYTAAAIASICYGLPFPVVDGNVFRVLSRYFDVAVPVDTGPGKRYFDALAREVMDTGRIGQYNQAIMEFGARQCVPLNPDCTGCPLHTGCAAYATGSVSRRPVKQGKPSVRKRYFQYLVPLDASLRTRMNRREGPGIWQGLYEFPLLEQQQPPGIGDMAELLGLPQADIRKAVRFNDTPIVHKLSHQHLYTTFWIVHTDSLPKEAVPFSETHRYPVPVLISQFMETVKNSYF